MLLWLVISQQKFLSCMAFSVYEVVCVACLSRINFMYYCRRPGFNRTTGAEEIFDFGSVSHIRSIKLLIMTTNYLALIAEIFRL